MRLITWTWSKGQRITAGLYYPPNYVPGRRYPLVIQTHGLIPDRFEFFGTFSTADAAQPLAARGMFVLQVDDMMVPKQYGKHGQLQEAETAIAIYRSAIETLSRKGLIDSKRVGIVGFSHTCFYVKWALAHEPGLFAAASVEEGEDGGYLQYMTGLNDYVDVDSLYGGAPFGPNLKTWISLSPGFNLDRLRTPLLIVVSHSSLVLSDWEWFQGLRDLGKLVHMVVLDDRAHDGHMLEEPWDQLVSSGQNVEWFDHWLNGTEDRGAVNEGRAGPTR